MTKVFPPYIFFKDLRLLNRKMYFQHKDDKVSMFFVLTDALQ